MSLGGRSLRQTLRSARAREVSPMHAAGTSRVAVGRVTLTASLGPSATVEMVLALVYRHGLAERQGLARLRIELARAQLRPRGPGRRPPATAWRQPAPCRLLWCPVPLPR